MSLLHLPQLLKHEELIKIDALLESSQFVSGVKTASMETKFAKNNLQIDIHNISILPQLQSIILRVSEISLPFKWQFCSNILLKIFLTEGNFIKQVFLRLRSQIIKSNFAKMQVWKY